MADRRPGILLGRLLERGAEDRVAEVVGDALAFEERQVGVLQIARAPAEHPRVERDHDRFIAGVAGAGDEARAPGRDPWASTADTSGSPADRVGDVLDRVRRGGAEDERQPMRGGRATDGELAVGVDDRLHADGREQHRRGHGRCRARSMLRSRSETSRSIRGTICQRSNARRLAPSSARRRRRRRHSRRPPGSGALAPLFERRCRQRQRGRSAAQTPGVDLVLEVRERLLLQRGVAVGSSHSDPSRDPPRGVARFVCLSRRVLGHFFTALDMSLRSCSGDVSRRVYLLRSR